MDEEVEVQDFTISSEKLYAVVELIIDKPNDEGESDVEEYICPAATNWLTDVKREETSAGQVKYHGTCLWPSNEAKLNSFLEKRTKPAPGWVTYRHTRILKFCRSLGHAKEQSQLALKDVSLSESDGGQLKKRKVVQPRRFGYRKFPDSDLSDSDLESPPLKSLKIVKEGSSYKTSIGSETPKDVSKGLEGDDITETTEVNPSGVDPKQGMVLKATNRCLFPGQDTGEPGIPEKGDEFIELPPNTPDQQGGINRATAVTSDQSFPTGSCANSTAPSTSYAETRKAKSSPKKKFGFSPRKVSNSSTSVSHFTFMREIRELRAAVNGLKISINKVYNCVCPVMERSNENEQERGIPAVPAESFEAMVTWENFLKDHGNMLHVVRLLTDRCVLTGLKESVNSMMKFILSNKLASGFNYKGKNKKGATLRKVSFLETKSCTAVNAALKAYELKLERSG